MLAMPSVTPNSCASSRAVRFSATSLKLAAVARTTPRVVATQKLPAASCKMAPTVSAGSPCRAVTAAHAVPWRRSKPASAVPTHNVPSASKCRQLPPANAPPNGPVTSAQVLLAQRKRPRPFTAHTLASSGFCAKPRTPGMGLPPGPGTRSNCPSAWRATDSLPPIHTRPAASSKSALTFNPPELVAAMCRTSVPDTSAIGES